MMRRLLTFAVLAALLIVAPRAQSDGIMQAGAIPECGGDSITIPGVTFAGIADCTDVVFNPVNPVIPCAQDGLDFTKSCNAILYVVLW